MLEGKGDLLPVSAFPVDGTWPTGTAQWEKRNLAAQIPVWDASICIQCNKCALVCPHAAIRAKVYPPATLDGAPATFKSTDYRGNEYKGDKFTIQVAPEDCTGCNLCVTVCPAKDKTNPRHKAIDMQPRRRCDAEVENYDFFLGSPRSTGRRSQRREGVQLLQPPSSTRRVRGCGETPYRRLATQPRRPHADGERDRLLVDLRRQPADDAVHDERRRTRPGLGELALRGQRQFGLGSASRSMPDAPGAGLVKSLSSGLSDTSKRCSGGQSSEAGSPRGAAWPPCAQLQDARGPGLRGSRRWPTTSCGRTCGSSAATAGPRHRLRRPRPRAGERPRRNILVLDTEVTLNTGGQASATPLGARRLPSPARRPARRISG
jgi:pyruvate-ferredoxin/flavodoxin oxidoreductase